MVELEVNIDSPEIVGEDVTVRGNLTIRGGSHKAGTTPGVSIAFRGEPPKAATVAGLKWNGQVTVPMNAIAGNPLEIIVIASAVCIEANLPHEEVPVDGTKSVSITLKEAPPKLTVELSDPTEVLTEPSQPYPFTFNGTAQAESGIASVQFRLGTDAFANVDNLSGDWAT